MKSARYSVKNSIIKSAQLIIGLPFRRRRRRRRQTFDFDFTINKLLSLQKVF